MVNNLRAVADRTNGICVSWDNPSENYSGCVLVYKAGSFPTGPSDAGATIVEDPAKSNIYVNVNDVRSGYELTGLTAGVTYYISIYSYYTAQTSRKYSDARTITCTADGFTYNTKHTLTYTQWWTVPAGWRRITYAVIGAGGAGGRSSLTTEDSAVGGGGGGSGYMYTASADVTPGQSILATVGVGTTGAGGASSFNGLTAGGGQPGGSGYYYDDYSDGRGGNGGTGGSVGGRYASYDGDTRYGGGDSAVNGANGNPQKDGRGTVGLGDGISKYFDGFRYCDGGAGGASNAQNRNVCSSAGTGSPWGGSGGGIRSTGQDGAANSGNGGGGAGATYNDNSPVNGGIGGSGVVIVMKAG